MDAGDMVGKFFIGDCSTLQIEDISKTEMICSFHSLYNYGVTGDPNEPDALDPSGGPYIALGYKLNDGTLKKIWWDSEHKHYLMLFERQ